jgi:hypothetical protein
MLSLKSGISQGIVVVIVLGILVKILSFGLGIFWNSAGKFELILKSIGIDSLIGKPLSYLILILSVWILGHLKPAVIIKHLFGTLLKKREERKSLFCVRIKSVLNGYPIALVSKIYFDQKSGKILYNVVFPNLGGMWTFIGVPAEDTERVEESVEEVLLTSFSSGFL